MKQSNNRTIERSNLKGFTLIELIVSISIIAIISGIFFANYRQTSNRANTKMAAQKLASEIRMVQNYAMSLKEKPQSGGVPENGWGIKLQNGMDEMIRYADDSDPPKKHKGAGDEEELSPYVFGEDIKIHDIEIDGVSGAGVIDYLYITFLPPNPETFICGSDNENSNNLDYPAIGANDCDPSGENAYITLIYGNDISTLVTVAVNKFGLVDVD